MSDGRNSRSAASRAAILRAARHYMADRGEFRPSIPQVAGASGRCIRTVFTHFKNVEAPHLAALEDASTFDAIWNRLILPAPLYGFDFEVKRRFVHAAVFGRAP